MGKTQEIHLWCREMRRWQAFFLRELGCDNHYLGLLHVFPWGSLLTFTHCLYVEKIALSIRNAKTIHGSFLSQLCFFAGSVESCLECGILPLLWRFILPLSEEESRDNASYTTSYCWRKKSCSSWYGEYTIFPWGSKNNRWCRISSINSIMTSCVQNDLDCSKRLLCMTSSITDPGKVV